MATFTSEITYGPWSVGMINDTGSSYRTIQSGTGAPPIYNSSALTSYRTARTNRASAPCNIAMCGASWEEGYNVFTYGDRYVDVLARTLRTNFPTSGATSMNGSTFWPTRYTIDPTGIMGTLYAWTSIIGAGGALGGGGIGDQAINLSTIAAGYRYTFTGTSFDMYYAAGAGISAGVGSVVIDGGTANIINNQTLSGAQAWNSGALSNTTHTIDVTFVSGVLFNYTGFMFYRNDEGKGMRILNGGRGLGSSITSGVVGVYFNDGFLKTANVALCVLDLINNDFSANLNPVTYKSNMVSIVASARYSAANNNLPVLLMSTNYPGDQGPRTYAYSQYLAKLKEIADADALVAVLDLSAYIPSCAYTPATPRDAIGYWDTDYNHPTAAVGHPLLASLVAAALSV